MNTLKKLFTPDHITTVAGAIGATAYSLSKIGINIGHIGAVSGNDAAVALATLVVGWYTAKKQ